MASPRWGAATTKCAGALPLALLAAAGAAPLFNSHYRQHDVNGERASSDAVDEPKRQKSSKQEKRAARIASRRASKDARLEAARAVRSRQTAQKRLEMSAEQRQEETERIKMRRVEQYQKLEGATISGVRVVVELSFLQTQKLRLGCFYGYLKQCPLDALLPLRVASCGTDEVAALCRQHGLASWKVWRHEAPVESVYSAEDLVFLSPDAEEVLEELDPSRVYVVGAIADRTVRKGEMMASATSEGLRSARLLVREHLAGARTHVLNIDAVLVTLSEFANHRDWQRAFARAVPKRIAVGRREKRKPAEVAPPRKQP